jgi:hypothetical protein
MAVLGFEAIGNTPEPAAAQVRAEGVCRAKEIRDAGIKTH